MNPADPDARTPGPAAQTPGPGARIPDSDAQATGSTEDRAGALETTNSAPGHPPRGKDSADIARDPLDRDLLGRNPAAPVPVVLALGANLGDPRATLASAVRALAESAGIELTGVSPVAVTAAVGGPACQPDYLNLVLTAQVTLSPRKVLAACHAVEQAHHRTREVRWGPRTLDIDVITYAGLGSDDPGLTLPHPRAHERAFVLAPWSWLDPQATLGGVRVAELAARAADAGTVRRLTAPEAGTGHEGALDRGTGAPAS